VIGWGWAEPWKRSWLYSFADGVTKEEAAARRGAPFRSRCAVCLAGIYGTAEGA